MSICVELTKLQRKGNFDTNPDPDLEWLLICHMYGSLYGHSTLDLSTSPRPGLGNLRPSTNRPLIDHVEPLSLTLTSVTFMRNIYVRFVLPLTAGIVFICNHWRPSGGIFKWHKADALWCLCFI